MREKSTKLHVTQEQEREKLLKLCRDLWETSLFSTLSPMSLLVRSSPTSLPSRPLHISFYYFFSHFL